MRVVEQRRLDLTAPVREYLPRLRLADADVSNRVTLRHLLTHTAGFVGDDFTDTGRGDDALARYVDNMDQLPQVTPLGELFSYCNAGFVVVGRVIEVVTGQTYEQAIRNLVLDPLEMANSTFEPHEVMLRRFVVGHESPFDDTGAVRIARPWALARAANPAGGLTASVQELLRYCRLHLGHASAAVLSEGSLQAMQAPLATAGTFAESVGVAWMLRSAGGVRVVEHSGGTHGQQTTIKLLPDQDFALVILTNSSRGAELHAELASWMLLEFLGISDLTPETTAIRSDLLTEYVGHYEQALSSIDVSAHDGFLILHTMPKGGFPLKDSPPGPTPPPVPYALWSADRIIGMDAPFKGARCEFLRNPGGRIAWLRSGGRLSARIEATRHD